jgi:membrane-associated phospholipid phosphatase
LPLVRLKCSRYGFGMRQTARGPLLAAAACFLAFAAVLACAYAIPPTGRLDAIALHGLMALDGPFSYPVGYLIVHSADPLPLTVALAALFAWGWALGRRREALAAVALVAGANLTGLILQVALAHPRFHPILGAGEVDAEAYPSGHATSAMSIALAAVLVAPTRLRVAVASGAAAYVIAVSIALMVLSWHFPSDVLGGLLVSSGFFFGAVAAIHASVASRAGIAAHRVRLALSPGLGGAAVAVLAAAGLIALSRAEELLAFARLHTVATVTALAIMAVSAGLVASATLISDP